MLLKGILIELAIAVLARVQRLSDQDLLALLKTDPLGKLTLKIALLFLVEEWTAATPLTADPSLLLIRLLLLSGGRSDFIYGLHIVELRCEFWLFIVTLLIGSSEGLIILAVRLVNRYVSRPGQRCLDSRGRRGNAN